jgi:acyl carrier protein
MTLDEIVLKAVQKVMPEALVTSETVVFGNSSSLDSMDLVGLLAEIEQQVFELYGKEITIASEKAMSQRNSPFRTVQSLADFVKELL